MLATPALNGVTEELINKSKQENKMSNSTNTTLLFISFLVTELITANQKNDSLSAEYDQKLAEAIAADAIADEAELKAELEKQATEVRDAVRAEFEESAANAKAVEDQTIEEAIARLATVGIEFKA